MRALITGASAGIGRATARVLAEGGWDLALHGHRHIAEARTLAQEAGGPTRGSFAVDSDLEAAGSAGELARAVRAHWDTLDALVLNAGIYPRRPFSELTEADFLAVFRLHVFSPAELIRELLPLLRKASPARIVFVSSQLAYTGSAHGAHYASAKAAQLGLARSLAKELAPDVLVNVIAPGSIDTAILADDSPERRAERERAIPLHRIGTPEEVARSIAFLLSPAASYITGTTLHVNGGVLPG